MADYLKIINLIILIYRDIHPLMFCMAFKNNICKTWSKVTLLLLRHLLVLWDHLCAMFLIARDSVFISYVGDWFFSFIKCKLSRSYFTARNYFISKDNEMLVLTLYESNLQRYWCKPNINDIMVNQQKWKIGEFFRILLNLVKLLQCIMSVQNCWLDKNTGLITCYIASYLLV